MPRELRLRGAQAGLLRARPALRVRGALLTDVAAGDALFRARESLRQCLQWVTAQGPCVDAGQLAQLLKQQIEVHSVESQRAAGGAGGDEADGGAGGEVPSRLAPTSLDDNLAGASSPERSGQTGGFAMEETPDADSRKRKLDDMLLLEDERLLQALPAVWPTRKSVRRSASMSLEPKISFVQSD